MGRTIFTILGLTSLLSCGHSQLAARVDSSQTQVRVAEDASQDRPEYPPSWGRTDEGQAPKVVPALTINNASKVLLAVRDGHSVAYLADADEGRVRLFDSETLTEIASLDVGGQPSQLAMSMNGSLFAALRDRNEVVAIDALTMKVVRRAKTACEPLALAVTRDGNTLLVASGWGHKLQGFNTEDFAKTFERDVGREPRALLLPTDARHVLVSHAIGAKIEDIDLTDAKAKATTLNLASGENGAGQGFVLASSRSLGGRIFAPHMSIRSTLDEDSSHGGGYGSMEVGPTEMFDVAVIDGDTRTLAAQSINNAASPECVLPRAAASTREGQLVIACLGSSEILSLDANAIDPHNALLQRTKVPAGPVGVAIDDESNRVLVWSEFARSLSWVVLGDKGGWTYASKNVPTSIERDAVLEHGRELFHTANTAISGDRRVCASCHPDGRDDGIVWQTPEGPRQAPMLAGRLQHTEPYGWFGNSKDVATHLTKTFQRLGGSGLKPDDREALIAYVMSIPTPSEEHTPVSPLVMEGRDIYESPDAACANCHGDDGNVADGDAHNVRSWSHGDSRGSFSTPSLHFVAGTAPYFHDGRYANLHDLLAKTKGTMGQSKKLSPHQLNALEAYVRTL